MEKEKKFYVGQTICINGYMSHDYAGEKFFRGGNQLLLEAISNRAKNIGKSIIGACIYPKARVKYYGSFMPSKNCYDITVEWVDPFDNSRLLPKITNYSMLESEFREFYEPIYRERKDVFKPGDWVYYMGAEAGGFDSGLDYWHEGVVGEIDSIDEFKGLLYFKKIGKMSYDILVARPANKACAFRKATHSEIMNAAHEEFVSKHGPAIDSMKPVSIKNQEDETKVSFQSKKLVANKVNNSKEIENFLLIN